MHGQSRLTIMNTMDRNTRNTIGSPGAYVSTEVLQEGDIGSAESREGKRKFLEVPQPPNPEGKMNLKDVSI